MGDSVKAVDPIANGEGSMQNMSILHKGKIYLLDMLFYR